LAVRCEPRSANLSARGGRRPSDTPEVQAGRRLDTHHEAQLVPRAVIARCAICGFSVSENSFDRPPFHQPLAGEVTAVSRWLSDHDLPEGTGEECESPVVGPEQ